MIRTAVIGNSFVRLVGNIPSHIESACCPYRHIHRLHLNIRQTFEIVSLSLAHQRQKPSSVALLQQRRAYRDTFRRLDRIIQRTASAISAIVI